MQNIINIQSGSTPEQNVFRNVINDLEDNEAEWKRWYDLEKPEVEEPP